MPEYPFLILRPLKRYPYDVCSKLLNDFVVDKEINRLFAVTFTQSPWKGVDYESMEHGLSEGGLTQSIKFKLGKRAHRNLLLSRITNVYRHREMINGWIRLRMVDLILVEEKHASGYSHFHGILYTDKSNILYKKLLPKSFSLMKEVRYSKWSEKNPQDWITYLLKGINKPLNKIETYNRSNLKILHKPSVKICLTAKDAVATIAAVGQLPMVK